MSLAIPDGAHMSLVSTLDKTWVGSFMREVRDIQKEFGREVIILTTGGTQKELQKEEYGIWENVHEVREYTGVDEWLGGGVKTIDPRVAAPLIARAGVTEDQEYLRVLGASPIQLVVINFYDFKKAVDTFEKSEKTVEDFTRVMENIDIWGPTNMRAALKRGGATPVIRPDRYKSVAADMKSNEGRVSPQLGAELGEDLMQASSLYETQIYAFLKKYHTQYIDYLANIELIKQGKRAPFKAWQSH